MDELQVTVARQEAEIRHLSRLIGAPMHQIVPVVERNPAAKKDASTYVSLDQAVDDAKAAMGKDSTGSPSPVPTTPSNNEKSTAKDTPVQAKPSNESVDKTPNNNK